MDRWEWDERSAAAGSASSSGPDELPEVGLDEPQETGLGASARVGGAAPSSRSAARARRGERRRLTVIVAVAAAVVLAAGAATAAVAVTRSHAGNPASLNRALSPMAATPPVTAVADVTPPVAAGSCGQPTAFSYNGTLSAAAPEVVTYRWIYSTGSPGPVQTVRFARAGSKLVAGQTVAARTAGGGWAELQVISPVARTSGKAVYRLLCGGTVAGITVTAAVTPAARTAGCVPAPPDFTAAGVIRAAKAATVTYYWALSNGQDSAVTTLTFHRPGTQAVRPLVIAPPAASGTGAAVLVMTSPVVAASRPAAYTLTCGASVNPPGGGTATAPDSSPRSAPTTTPSSHSTPSSPARTTSPTSPSSPPSSTPPASYLTVDGSGPKTVTEGDTFTCTVTVSGGKAPYHWSAAGLPPGLVARPSGSALVISGVPTASGDFLVTVTVTDSSSPAITENPEIPIWVATPPMTVTVNAPSTAFYGQPYSGTVTATGGDGTYTWRTTSVETGLILTPNGATLTISGAPDVLARGRLRKGPSATESRRPRP